MRFYGIKKKKKVGRTSVIKKKKERKETNKQTKNSESLGVNGKLDF